MALYDLRRAAFFFPWNTLPNNLVALRRAQKVVTMVERHARKSVPRGGTQRTDAPFSMARPPMFWCGPRPSGVWPAGRSYPSVRSVFE